MHQKRACMPYNYYLKTMKYQNPFKTNPPPPKKMKKENKKKDIKYKRSDTANIYYSSTENGSQHVYILCRTST